MPHQCITCGRSFPDGSKEMLSGCPECGGNKFQFHPPGKPPETPDDPPSTGSTVSEAVGSATATVRDIVGGGGSPRRSPADETDAPEPTSRGGERGAVRTDDPDAVVDPPAASEDTAQADARSDMVRPDELPSAPARRGQPAHPDAHPDSDRGADAKPAAGPGSETGTDDPDPDLAALREELNDQFESIRIVEPGEYELNLMELYDRQEYIIALQENGRYVIQAADSWTGG